MSTEALDQLESRSVADVVPEKAPELTLENQKQLLLVQRQILSLKVNISEAQKQLDSLAPVFNNMVTKLATDLKVDANKYAFDIDTLSFIKKQ